GALGPALIRRASRMRRESVSHGHPGMVQRRGPFDLRLRLVELLDAPMDAVGNGGVGERVQVRRLHAAPRFLDDARLRHVDDLTHGAPPRSERMIYRGRLRMPHLEVLMTLRERLD